MPLNSSRRPSRRGGQPQLTGRRSLILVCEDDPCGAAFFSDALEAAGYRTVAVPDGEVALRVAARLRPATIILDLALPGLDGAAVLCRLKAERRTASIPVVIVSAYPGWLTFLDRSQAVAVLEKPCLPAELEAAVAQALASRGHPPIEPLPAGWLAG